MPKASRTPAAPPAASPQHTIFAGTSGWSYPSWKPDFYPADTPSRSFLSCYAARLNSVEVNYTFRSLPTATMVAGWLKSAPAPFQFSFKAPQRVTHSKRLRDCDAAMKEFLDCLRPVGKAQQLGLLLFQLPPNFKADVMRLQSFLRSKSMRRKDLRFAFEFRHESWFSDETYAVLRERNAALCVAEGDTLATPDIPTADFRCYRLRKSGGYSDRKLAAIAKEMAAAREAGDVFVYFRHEDEPTGPRNAHRLLALTGGVR